MYPLILLALAACAGTPPAAPSPEGAATAPQTEAPATSDWTHYGSPFAQETVVPASTLLADPSVYADQTVRVEGVVADVCQKMGCWMVLTDDAHTMRVTMKDHAFGVAKDGKGRKCQIEGQIIAKEIDPETVAHLASEASEGAPIPEAGKTGMQYELVATSVSMAPGL